MSTEGTGAVVGVAVAGVAVAGVVIAGAAVVGAGILVGRGIMWCRDRLVENYENACHEWTAFYEENRRKSLANQEAMPDLVAHQLQRYAAASVNLRVESDSTSGQLPAAMQSELEGAVTRALLAVEDTKAAMRMRVESEQELLTARLRAEIETARGLLPQDKIAAAEAALQGTAEEKRNQLLMLQNSWKMITASQALRTRQERQTRQLLRESITELRAIEQSLLRDKATPVYSQKMQAIEAQIKEAEKLLTTNVAEAFADAGAALKSVRDFAKDISNDILTAWDNARKDIVRQQSVLDTLGKMLGEGDAIKIVTRQKKAELEQRLLAATTEAKRLLHNKSTAPGELRALELLKQRVTLLKEDVFKVVKTGQQGLLAQAIAGTLAEPGMLSAQGAQVVTQQIDDKVSVVATQSGESPGFAHDEKVVAFTISHDGDISYDFSGYVGESCIAVAEKVFAALRTKGIFILDEDAIARLRSTPTRDMTIDTLRQAQFNVAQNKHQADLAQRIQKVLDTMSYKMVRQSVVEGIIEFEAFNGPLGYRVVLPPDGTAQIFKNRSEVTGDNNDPVAAEAQREAITAGEENPSSTENTSSNQRDMRKRQQLRQ